MPLIGEPIGARPAQAAEPDDQSKGAVQPAFSAISRPCIKELDCMDTSFQVD